MFILALTACASRSEKQTYTLPPEPEEGVLVYAALNPVAGKTQNLVNSFNENHTDVQIEIRDYSDENGPQRLLVELAAGRVPDIMELHRIGTGFGSDAGYTQMATVDRPDGEYWMPYQQLAARGYLEDLWPYIENDPELGRDSVLEAPLRAAEINGSLYMLFGEVSITTLAAPERLVGARTSWTIEEMLEVFSTFPPDSTILHYDATKWDAFSRMFCTTLNQYVNWETGTCSFDSEEFHSMLELLNMFPDEFDDTATPEEIKEEHTWRLLEGRQLLEPMVINKFHSIPYSDAYFGEGNVVSFIGFPTSDGSSGSFFNLHGTKLAMASTCSDKEAAWEFMRHLVGKNYSSGEMKKAIMMNSVKIPVNRRDYEMETKISYGVSTRGVLVTFTGGPRIKIRDYPDESDLQRFETLLNNTTQIYWPDDELSNIVWEAIGPYFAGDKSLDDTLRLLDNRVSLYINERR